MTTGARFGRRQIVAHGESRGIKAGVRSKPRKEATDLRSERRIFCRHNRGSSASPPTFPHGLRRGPHYGAAAAAGNDAGELKLAEHGPCACPANGRPRGVRYHDILYRLSQDILYRWG